MALDVTLMTTSPGCWTAASGTPFTSTLKRPSNVTALMEGGSDLPKVRLKPDLPPLRLSA